MGLFQLSGSPAGHVTTTGTKRVGAPLAGNVFNQLSGTLDGNYLYGGPGFQAAQQAAYNTITPQVQSAFSRGGRLNSGLAQVAHTQALGDSFAGLYNNERNRQLQAAQIAPSVTQDVAENQPYFENDLATLAGLLGVGGSLLGAGSSGAGGLLGTLGNAGKSLYDYLFPGATTVANGLGSGVLGFGGSPGFADALTGTPIDASSGFTVNNAGGPGLGGGSSGSGLGGVPTPPGTGSSVLNSLGGGSPGSSLSGAAPGVVGDFSAGNLGSNLSLGGLGAGAFGVANSLGPATLGFGGSGVSGLTLGGAGALDLGGVAGGLVNTSAAGGAAGAAGGSAAGGASSGLGAGAGALGFAAPALIAAVAANAFAGKAATRSEAIGIRDAFTNSLSQAPRGPSGGALVDIPGAGQMEIVGGGPDYEYDPAGFVFRTADGGQLSFINAKPEYRPPAVVQQEVKNLAEQHAYGRGQGYVEGSRQNDVTRTGRSPN